MFLLYHKIENSYFTMYFFNQDISYNIAPNLLKSGWSRDRIQDFSFFHIEKWLWKPLNDMFLNHYLSIGYEIPLRGLSTRCLPLAGVWTKVHSNNGQV